MSSTNTTPTGGRAARGVRGPVHLFGGWPLAMPPTSRPQRREGPVDKSVPVRRAARAQPLPVRRVQGRGGRRGQDIGAERVQWPDFATLPRTREAVWSLCVELTGGDGP